MNFYEEQVIKIGRRIKRVEENPDPTRLKTNKLRYELQLERAKEHLEAWQQGKPFLAGGIMVYLPLLVRAMGFVFGGADEVVFATTAAQSQKYLDLGRAKGLPIDRSCDMVAMPAAVEFTEDTPKEDFTICDNHACTPAWLRGVLVSHTHGITPYFLDIGFDATDANLEHVTDQLGEFIEWAEKKVPGIKYDEDKLIEMQELAEEGLRYSRDIWEMLAHKPCPIGGKDSFIGFQQHSRRGVEFMRALRDEVAERIEKGIAAVPGEKLRVGWAVTNPVFMDVYKVLAKWKIVVPMQYDGPRHFIAPLPGPVYFGGRKLTPLEKEAAKCLRELWGGRGSRWVDNLILFARHLKVDALVNYMMLGCTATLGLKQLVEEAVEKRLGIPVLQLAGSQWNSNYASEATITAKLDEFAQTLLSQRGLT